MNKTGSLYIERESIVHEIQGSIKFIMLLAWTIFVFMFMDIRVFTIMGGLGVFLVKLAKIPFKNIKPLVIFVIIFTFFNSIFLIIITPKHGSELTGTYSEVMKLFGRELTYETLFFALTLSFKYLSILPITLLFVFTTHPSRFASGLNRIGISYKIAYAINIALRYIPDVKEEMKNIINAQEARGVCFNKKEAKLFKRLKNHITILIPLLISSLNRIEVVSNAMELRGFGRYKERTWYNRRPYKKIDFVFLSLSILLVILGFVINNTLSTKFWYPF
ncbi:energy-coupling factor transporter transmembrane component T family protein [Dethiothermospora halolimnae]|uniref:energy-coupling factor transporter transmembrane component T family protein n=1 Tax=Dethiothermospora halolimnae TaxID=3114390 RepID=UPI003CCBB9CC